MRQTTNRVRHWLETLMEKRRLAAQRRVDAYLAAIGLIDPPDRR